MPKKIKTKKDRRAIFDLATYSIGRDKDSLNKWMYSIFLEDAIDKYVDNPKRALELKETLVLSAGIIQGLDLYAEDKVLPRNDFAGFWDRLGVFSSKQNWAKKGNDAIFMSDLSKEEYKCQYNAMRDEKRSFGEDSYEKYLQTSCDSNGLQILIRHGFVALDRLTPNEPFSEADQAFADNQNRTMRISLDILKLKLDEAKGTPNVVIKYARENRIPNEEAAGRLLKEVDEQLTEMEGKLEQANPVFSIYHGVNLRIRDFIDHPGAKALIATKAVISKKVEPSD